MARRKNDITISLSMLTDEQKDSIESFAQRYGMTQAAFMRYCTMKLVADELIPATMNLNPKKIDSYLTHKETIGNLREKAGFPRGQNPHTTASRILPTFGLVKPTV